MTPEARMSHRVALLIGTPKGAFIIDGDADRREWSLRGPMCDAWPIHDISVDASTGAILAGGGSPWYGPAVWRSDDIGATWTHSSEGLTYGDGGPKLKTVWNVTAAEGVIYAGVEPAGLFRSRDDGATWEHIEGLTNHPTRSEWVGGAGGLILHSIVPHRTDAESTMTSIPSNAIPVAAARIPISDATQAAVAARRYQPGEGAEFRPPIPAGMSVLSDSPPAPVTDTPRRDSRLAVAAPSP